MVMTMMMMMMMVTMMVFQFAGKYELSDADRINCVISGRSKENPPKNAEFYF